MTETTRQGRSSAEAYYAGLPEVKVAPLWKDLGNLLPKEPKSKAIPHVWKYTEIKPHLMEAGNVVTAEEAERRVLMLMNPGFEGERAAATNMLYAGLQLVLPGEIAGPHRHTPAALRFIVEGSGAYTTVEGERTLMEFGDMVLTPNWAIHDHGNESEEPMIWLDGLDLPLVNSLEATFFEDFGDEPQELTKPIDASAHLFTTGRLNPPSPPSQKEWNKPYSPIVNYPWKRTQETLKSAAQATKGTPEDGVIFEYTNPYTGGPVMPTMSCYIQLLAPGMHTQAHRHTSSAVYHVARGSGYSIIDGQKIEWEEKDTFALPGWAVHEHVNSSASGEAILFSFTDEPVLRALGLYREAGHERQEG